MALNGRLEDMNLLEILQIVAFSKKTGTLRIEGPMGNGAVLFQNGLIRCAFSSTTSELLEQIVADETDETRIALFRDHVHIALRELVGLREGTFQFHLDEGPPPIWEGFEIARFPIEEGLEPEHLMLELARELDDDRQYTATLLESGASGTEPVVDGKAPKEATPAEPHAEAEPSILSELNATVLLVDDEAPVLAILADELTAAGCAVEIAGGPEEALSRIEQLTAGSATLLVVTDLAMPSSSGDSFQGGFEIVANLDTSRTPVMLMTESLSPGDRARAMELGIRKVAFKPALTKLDAEEYKSDLRLFAGVIRRELTGLVADVGTAPQRTSAPSLNHDVMFDFLKTMTDQLTHPGNAIARMILRVATKYAERGLVFLVKGAHARGLAAVRLGRPSAPLIERTQRLAFDLQQVRAFAEVVYSRVPTYMTHEKAPLPAEIETDAAVEYVLLPLLHNHEVIAILLADNPNTGNPLGKLSGLELFLAQAGMAMENASLHRRLSSSENRFSLEDQGPLTQELNEIIRGIQ